MPDDKTRISRLPVHVGIGEASGRFIPLIRAGTPLPAEGSFSISTEKDYQMAIDISLFMGLRPVRHGNLLLGSYRLEGIEPAPKGRPQIDLTVAVDISGRISLGAANVGTGSRIDCEVRPLKALTQPEYDRLVDDRDSHHDEDRIFLYQRAADKRLESVRSLLEVLGLRGDVELSAKTQTRVARTCREIESVLPRETELAQTLCSEAEKLLDDVMAERSVLPARAVDSAKPAASRAPLPGTDDPYTLIEKRFKVIERRAGGMGIVLVIESGEGKKLALKTVRPDLPGRERMVGRFQREAMIWMSIGGHSNIVKPYFVESVAGLPCILMEYVAGTVKEVIGRVPESAGMDYAIQCCRGLRHAYRVSGIVHRDIKPSNMLLEADGTVKVSDFGIAAGVAEPDLPDHGANSGADPRRFDAGTMYYASPEQLVNPRNSDFRSDIYSFGVLLYQLLTGRLPFYGKKENELLRLQMREAPIRPANINAAIPSGVDAMIMNCLEKQPEDRPDSYDKILECLEAGYERCAGIPYERQERIDSDTPWSLLSRGLSFDVLGDPGQALGFYARACAENVKYAPAWEAAGRTLQALGRFDEARKCLVKAISIQPASIPAVCDLAFISEQEGDFDKARILFKKAYYLI
jgi:serine/threonine protein kinase